MAASKRPLDIPSQHRAHTSAILGNLETTPADTLHTATVHLHGDSYLRDLAEGVAHSQVFVHELRAACSTSKGPIIHPIDGKPTTVEQLLEPLETAVPDNWSLVALDKFRHEHPSTSRCLAAALLHLPPHIVSRIVGMTPLLWTLANLDHEWSVKQSALGAEICHQLCNSKNRLEQHLNKMGFDVVLLEKAQRAVLHWVHPDSPTRTQSMLMNYNLLRAHQDRTIEGYCGLAELLKSGEFTVKAGDPDEKIRGNFPETRRSEYSICALMAEGRRDYGDTPLSQAVITQTEGGANKIYHHFIDAPLGFSLRWKGLPQATLSGLITDPSTFFVIQAQGLQPIKVDHLGNQLERSGSRGLIGLRWQKLLIAVAEQYCKAYDIKRIGILGSANNQWLGSERNTERTFRFAHAMKGYDAIADQIGFVFHHDTKNFLKVL